MERHGTRKPSQADDSLRQLERDRTSNDNKLKTRFEHIFRKYEHDFEGVGDEIEIASGSIVVNNGHLQHMRYEVDPGKGASWRFVRTFQEKLEEEGEEDEDEEDSSGLSSEDDDGEDSGKNDKTPSVAGETPAPYGRESTVDTVATGSTLRRTLKPFSQMTRPAPRLAQLLIGQGTPQYTPGPGYQSDADSQDTASNASATPTPSAMLGRVPNLHQSVLSLNASRQNVDHGTIEALGVSIANQLAQLMAGSTKSKEKRKKRTSRAERRVTESRDPVWDYPEIERRSQSKRRRSQSAMPPPPLPSSPQSVSPGASSLWAPSEAGPGRKRRRLDLQPEQHHSTPTTLRQTASLLPSSGSRPSATEVKRCWNCSLTSSADWHKGPHDQDLCSSCGKYYEYHRRMKPFDSPTPSVEDGASTHDPVTEIPDSESDEDIIYEDQSNQEMSLEPPFGSAGLENAPAAEQETLPADLPARPKHATSKTSTRRQKDSSFSRPLPKQAHAPPAEATAHRKGADANAAEAMIEEHAEKQETPVVSVASPSGYSANTSRPLLTSPSTRAPNMLYTVEEDALIIRLKEREMLTWDSIGKHFTGRTSLALQTRYGKLLRDHPSRGRQLYEAQIGAMFDPAASASEFALWKDRAWNKEQDEVLFDLREDKALTWSEIAQLLPGHTPEAVAKRYEMLVEAAKRHRMRKSDQPIPEEDGIVQRSDPIMRRKDRFSAEEDALIVRLREIEGLGWIDVATRFPGRNMYSVQRRYSSVLDPKKRAKKKTSRHDPVWGTIEDRILAVDPTLSGGRAWTQAEDDMIKQLREQDFLGWDEIAARVWMRTSKEVQHRYEYKFAGATETQSSRSIRDEAASRLYAAAQKSKASTAKETARPGPGGRRPFTEKEDDLVLRLKEQGLSWEDITLQLPGRSVKAVSSRYEEVLGPAKENRPSNEQPTDRSSRDIVHLRDSLAPAHTPMPNELSVPSPRLNFEPHEDRLIISLREKGLEWDEIGAQMPHRTLGTIKNHWCTKLKYTVRRSLPSTKDKYMLRQAIGNRLRRRTVDNPMRYDDPAQDELAVDDNGAVAQATELQSASDDRSVDSHEPQSIGTQVNESTTSRETSVASDLEMFESVLQAATRFAIQQNNPTLLTRIRKIYDDDPNDPRLHRLLELVSTDSASTSEVMTALENVVNTSPESSKNATRSLQAALITSAGPPAGDYGPSGTPQAHFRLPLHNDSIVMGEEDDIDNAVALMDAFDPAENLRSSQAAGVRVNGSSPGDAQVAEKTNGHQAWGLTSARTRPWSANEDPHVTPEGTPPPLDTQESPSSADRHSVESPLASPMRPELSFSQLVRIAFEASSRPMQPKDIYDWVEENYEFYRLSPPSWKSRIRAELSANPSFERTVNEEGANAWRLVEGVDTESWGVTRGPRRKRGAKATPQPAIAVPEDASATMLTADDDDDQIAVASPSRPATPHVVGERHEETSQREGLGRPSSELVDSAVGGSSVGEALADLDHLSLEKHETMSRPRRKSPKVAARKRGSKKSTSRRKSAQHANSLQEQQTIDLTMLDDELSSDPVMPRDSSPMRSGMAESTSPLFVRPSTPAGAHGRRGSPRTSSLRSSSIKREPMSTSKNSPLPTFVQRSTPFGNSVRRTSGLARFMETPMREVDSDEDELASVL